MISSHPSFRLGLILLAAVAPFATLQAGDDSVPAHPASVGVTAEMNDYLQAQKVAHSVEFAPGKGEREETLMVKIYGVSIPTQQDAICAALGATAKKEHVRDATVLFFTVTAATAGQSAAFQPSQLPSGNGDVEFPREPRGAGNQLQRTVKL